VSAADGNGSAGPLMPPSETEAPPPAPALLAAVQEMRPVRPRVPARAVLAVAAAALALPTFMLLGPGPRKDLAALPLAWVAAMGVCWAAGFLVVLLAATWPRRGEVLPDTARAGRAALLVGTCLLLLGLFATVDAPGTTVPEATFAAFSHFWWHCTRFGLEASAPVLLVGGLVLRRLFPIGSAWAGAALGATGGAMAGLTLHFICPIGGGLHVGFAHAGNVAVGALLGMILLPRVLRT
jgi:hypothetical protein